MASLMILQALLKLQCVDLRRHSHLHQQRIGFGSGLSPMVIVTDVVLWLAMFCIMTQLPVNHVSSQKDNDYINLILRISR